MPPRNPDVTFAELFALISAARITINDTCLCLNVSREAWRGYARRKWGMSPKTRARAETMIAAVRFYIDRGVLPSPDRDRQADAYRKILAKVEERHARD